MIEGGRRLEGGGRFVVTAVDGPPATVVKRGPAGQLAREATALRRLAPLGLAPRLLAARPGSLTTELLPGAARPLEWLSRGDAWALGAVLRRVHDVSWTATGGLPGWRSRVRSLDAYRRRRIADMLAAAGPDRQLAEQVVTAAGSLPPTDDPAPFRLLHGDLAGANILWDPAPRLVDWEFWRMGDPAEDLAYLAEINDLPDRVLAGVLDGYADRQTAEHVPAWRPLCALDTALWYRDAGDAALMTRLTSRFG